MGFTFKVETRKLPALRKRLDKLNGTEVDVGFFEEDRYGPENDNLPVAQVAYFNEFGTVTNPTRPFMEETFSDPTTQKHAGKLMKLIFESALTNGRAVQRLLITLGDDVAEQMKNTIMHYPGSNSPKTIEKKGGRNTPLRDTEFMMNSVKFQISR
ncbi:hypothetical protein CNR37_00003 [Pseudomonas phage ventosus]|uniref:Uncharacterized protein n=1 Tax=Pseudomonas phage ventosus TaxID=2048980 RepID=A0A2H4P7R2_9CAUD|nr:hypothetical protein CNR37_00003 [Pseudomonas phage ventosus]